MIAGDVIAVIAGVFAIPGVSVLAALAGNAGGSAFSAPVPSL